MTRRASTSGARAGRKYGNRRVQLDGYTFDSAKEAARYQELRLLEQAGVIVALTVHPRYELLPAFRDAQGRWHRNIEYEADFAYSEDGRVIVEDTKGVETDTFKLKRKLFCYKYSRIYELRVL